MNNIHTVERGDAFVPEPHQRITEVRHTSSGTVQVVTVSTRPNQLTTNRDRNSDDEFDEPTI